jgi:hypothetical protein
MNDEPEISMTICSHVFIIQQRKLQTIYGTMIINELKITSDKYE